jgi:hypothetical protein
MRRRFAVFLLTVLGAGLVATNAIADTTTTSSTTTATTVTVHKAVRKVPVAPLTGVPEPGDITKHRSALTIKIENTPEARPQYGIEDADVVYEEICEGGITRLAAIFNSRLPAKVGPVRSVRRTDREIVSPIGGIFAFSGGAQYALNSIATAPVKTFDQSNSGAAMFRDPLRYAPHNLYANAALLMKMGGVTKSPPPLFTYTKLSSVTPGQKVRSFVVGFAAGYETTYTWNAANKSWDRSIFGQPDIAASGVRLSPRNVIVMSVHYQGGLGVIGAEAVLTGRGTAEVFSGGTVQRATWTRASLRRPIIYRALSGRVIALKPGQTWVTLLDVSENVTIQFAP